MDRKLFEYINEKYFKNKNHVTFDDFLKINLSNLEEGYAELEMTVEEEHLNLIKIVHGGILASIADIAMGIACISCKKKVVTTEMNISYVRSVGVNSKLIAKASVDNNGNNLMRTKLWEHSL
jgi:acyl-CoA thioesterase